MPTPSSNPATINLTQRQTMLSLAYLSYTGEGLTIPNPAGVILQDMNTAIKKISFINNWKIVWGPVVYTVPGSMYQDNLMYIAQNTNDTTQYAIGIRGTNFLSDVDWLLEDFDVLRLMPWPVGATTPSPAGAGISESTSMGMAILLGMTDTVTTQQSFTSYLQSITKSKINICVTGHSKGGVLATTMALYLLDNQNSGTKWDSSGASTVSCISFAGPTAGNAAFAAYSDAQFVSAFQNNPPPASCWDASLGTNCDVVQCSYDVAPLVWAADNICTTVNGSSVAGPITYLYGANINFKTGGITFPAEMTAFTDLVLSSLAGMVSAQGYTQLNNAGGVLPGVFNGPVSTNDTFADYLSAFMAQATWQHSNSYPTILGAAQLIDPSVINRNIISISTSSVLSGAVGATLSNIVLDVENLSLLTGAPAVSVSGGGVTATVTNITQTQITVDLSISAKAVPGQVCGLTVNGPAGLNSLGSNALIFYIELGITLDPTSPALTTQPGGSINGIIVDIPNVGYIPNPVLTVVGNGISITNQQVNDSIFQHLPYNITANVQVANTVSPGTYPITVSANGISLSNALILTVS